MQNFTYYNPAKVIFGKGTIAQIGAEAKVFGRKALFVYDKNATAKNGVYQTIVDSLREAGIEFVEYTEIRPNPVLSQVQEGIVLAKKEKVDFVIGAGGGSAIDEAKAIAAGACTDHDVWDYFLGKATLEKALPVLAVITKSATGTETNGGSVIHNEQTDEKLGLVVSPLIPKIAFMDPVATFSVPAEQTAYGAVDAMSHVLEGYLTNDDPDTPWVDEYCEGISRTLISSTDRILNDPEDYNARAAYMWAAALAWNGLVLTGIGNCGYPNHLIGHSMSALYGVQHGASISISFSGWMPWFIKESPAGMKKMAQFGNRVFGIVEPDTKIAAEKTVEHFRKWFKKIGAPTKLSDLDIDNAGLQKIAENVELCSSKWGMTQYDKELAALLLNSCEYLAND